MLSAIRRQGFAERDPSNRDLQEPSLFRLL